MSRVVLPAGSSFVQQPQTRHVTGWGNGIGILADPKKKDHPVEVGSLNPIIYRCCYIPGGCLGFRPSAVWWEFLNMIPTIFHPFGSLEILEIKWCFVSDMCWLFNPKLLSMTRVKYRDPNLRKNINLYQHCKWPIVSYSSVTCNAKKKLNFVK